VNGDEKSQQAESAEKSFEVLMKELESIVTQLEKGDLSLEQCIALFERGMKVSTEGTQKLDNAEKRVEMLLNKNGKERLVPFAPEGKSENGPGQAGETAGSS